MKTVDAPARRLRVAQLAAEVGVSADAIRYYEREGLLHAPERSAAGYRLPATGYRLPATGSTTRARLSEFGSSRAVSGLVCG